MQTKKKILRLFVAITLIGAAINFSNCADDKKTDLTPLVALLALTGNSGPADIPQPALNTATLMLGQSTFILTDVQFCKLGINQPGITIGQTVATYPPGLNIHNIDPSKTTITIGSGGSQMDIDTTGGVYQAGKNKVAGTCTGTVKENTTVYDLQVLNCPITDELNGNLPDTTVSFRARCTKQ